MKKYKNLINLAIAFSLTTTSLFGYTSNLVSPKNGSKIIDIGSPDPINKIDVKIPKSWVEIEAQVREIDNLVYLKDRNMSEKWDCIADEMGHENCSQGLVDCSANPSISSGTASLVAKEITKNKEKIAVPREEAVSPNIVNGNRWLNPNAGAINGATFTVSADIHNSSLPSPTTLMSQGYVNADGKFSVKIFSFTSGSGEFYLGPKASSINFVLNQGHSIVNNASWTGVGGGNGKYSVAILTWDTPPATLSYICDDYCVMSPPDDPELGFWGWGCEGGFSSIDSINGPTGQCKKRYTYYNYTCPTDSNVYGGWEGPVVSTGGDCLGACGPDNCACNSSTPPSGNCILPNYVCPSNANQVCTKTSTGGTTLDNYSNMFIYDNGYSVEHNKTKTSEKVCEEGKILENGKCIKDTSYSCMQPGFSFNSEANECVKLPDCTGGATDASGQCFMPKTYTCPGGYSYDSELGDCKKNPVCDKGSFSLITHKCEASPSSDMCEPGYIFSEERAACEKYPITKMNKACTLAGATYTGTQSFLAGENICIYSDILLQNIPTGKTATPYNWGPGVLTSYGITLGEFSFSFKVLNSGTYTLKLQIDNYGNASIDNGPTLLSVNNWMVEGSKTGIYLAAGDHTIQVNGYNIDNISGMGAAIVEESSGKVIWNTRTGQSIELEYCPTAPNVRLDSTKGYCVYDMQCEAGYTYNLSHDVCYIDRLDADEDFILNAYIQEPSCLAGPISGSFIAATGSCAFNPTCSDGGTFNEITNQCQYPEVATCPTGTISSTSTIPGLENSCKMIEPCPFGTTLTNLEIDNQNIDICVGGKIPDCSITETLNPITMKCESTSYCPSGYKELSDGTCKQDYAYFTYHCEAPFEGPNIPGEDCDGKCGGNGCYCNASAPLPNNCKKPFSFTPTVETFEKRALIGHDTKGSLTAYEFGQNKGYDCGENCLFTVNKITGNGNQLCFNKKNGEEGCFTVDNCFFRGSISNELGIRELQVGSEDTTTAENLYQYQLAEGSRFKVPEIANNDDITCYSSSLFYNPTTRDCQNDTTGIDFSTWLKFGTDGNWVVSTDHKSVRQTVNGKPTFFLSNDIFSNVVFEGKMMTSDSDDDYMGMVFGWQSETDFFAVDWKGGGGNPPAKTGLRLIKVKDGDFGTSSTTGGTVGLTSWGTPTSTSSIDVLASNFTYGGYTRNQYYTMKVETTRNSFILYIDGVKALEYNSPTDIFPETGKIGFLNVSQASVYYKDFFVQSAPKCPTGFGFDTSSKLCLKVKSASDQENTIHSTCKLNGHVGWIGNSTGIVSAKVGDQIDFSIPETMGIPELVMGQDLDNNTSTYDKSARIEFWDPYVDGYLGFLEFVKEPYSKDREDGFHPKNERAFDLGEHGFTSISNYGTTTYFVSAETVGIGMTETDCTNIENKYGLTRVTDPLSLEAIYLKRLAGDRIKDSTLPPICSVGVYNSGTGLCDYAAPGSTPFLYCKYGELNEQKTACSVNKRCILKEPNKYDTFNMYDEAYKVLSSTGAEVYQCAPLTCKDHYCQEAYCPDGYIGTLHNASEVVPSTACVGQTCDANKEYYPYCGKTGGCPTGPTIVQEGLDSSNTGNQCFEYYCENGTFDPVEKKCKTFACPPNTYESSDHKYCIRK